MSWHTYEFLLLGNRSWKIYFFRTLCGYNSTAAGQEPLFNGARHYPSLAAAEAAVLGSNRFMLWENSGKIIARCSRHIGMPATAASPRRSGIQETVIKSNSARLDALAAVRHRIVHDQSDAKARFDDACRLFAGRTFPASRPGKFLRAIDANSPTHAKWIDTAATELTGLARQMV